MAKRRFCLNMTYGVLFGNVKVRKRWFNNLHNAFNCCSLFLTVFRYDGTKIETKIANIIDLAMLY